MDPLTLVWKLIPFVLLLGYGAYSILEVFFPSIRSSNFNRWEIDEDTGSSIQVMGWKKALSPPRVLASGYLSERAACTLASSLGIVFVAIAVLGIRHTIGMPLWFPDVFSRFSH
jgi:hypothetical protein